MSQPCTQPGCTGAILDGYCDTCGMAPPGPVSGPVTGPVSGRVTGSGLDAATGSTRLESAPLGSRRATAATAVTRRVRARGKAPASRLGNGISVVPDTPVLDPRGSLQVEPQVPENKRFCPRCGGQVGRSRNGQPGRTSGYCPACGSRFDFEPQLKPGDLVAGQYEVAGALAHGGMGWIFLAIDRLVADRWVVLKGLLNTEDADAREAAAAEQRFLAQVSPPTIVKIFNFTRHAGAGYIVMEYIGGKSLKDLVSQRRQDGGRRHLPMPVDHALAFMVEVLGAFAYLHDHGLLYCDLKPDNVLHVGDEVRLIDLGAVRRFDDESAIFGTKGYQAPEIAAAGPSVASDLYTVGRTLLVLTCHVSGFTSTYVHSLPAQASAPALAASDSFYRLLVKACAPEPADRFVSADEMRVQALGVQREVAAAAAQPPDGTVRPAPQATASGSFSAPASAGSVGDWRELPEPLPDRSDPGAAFLESLSEPDPGARLALLDAGPADSVDVRLERARTLLRLAGDDPRIDEALDALLQEDPWEWRALWWQGVAALCRGRAEQARAAFNAVYGELPGELAPKLALAYACELSGEDSVAEELYLTCARTDAAYVAPAAFGLARLRTGRDLDAAVAALDLIPVSSSAQVAARQATAELLVRSARHRGDLDEGLRVATQARFSPHRLAELGVQAWRRALALDDTDPTRVRLEGALRELARLTPDPHTRYALVDEANQVRPWSTT